MMVLPDMISKSCIRSALFAACLAFKSYHIGVGVICKESGTECLGDLWRCRVRATNALETKQKIHAHLFLSHYTQYLLGLILVARTKADVVAKQNARPTTTGSSARKTTKTLGMPIGQSKRPRSEDREVSPARSFRSRDDTPFKANDSYNPLNSSSGGSSTMVDSNYILSPIQSISLSQRTSPYRQTVDNLYQRFPILERMVRTLEQKVAALEKVIAKVYQINLH